MIHIFAIQDQQREDYRANSAVHGTGGPQAVDDIHFKTPLADAFLQAGKDAGIV
jgi:hypothetical protein